MTDSGNLVCSTGSGGRVRTDTLKRGLRILDHGYSSGTHLQHPFRISQTSQRKKQNLNLDPDIMEMADWVLPCSQQLACDFALVALLSHQDR